MLFSSLYDILRSDEIRVAEESASDTNGRGDDLPFRVLCRTFSGDYETCIVEYEREQREIQR